MTELEGALSTAWAFEAHDSAGEAVQVSGGVRELAMTPQPESHFKLVSGGKTFEHFGCVGVNRDTEGRLTLSLGQDVYLELPPGIGEGTYPIQNRRRNDDDITVN